MKLVLVRHGRPDKEDTLRSHDPGLRADGRRHAQAVASLLAREAVTHIVSSPLTRAAETARPPGGASRPPPLSSSGPSAVRIAP